MAIHFKFILLVYFLKCIFLRNMFNRDGLQVGQKEKSKAKIFKIKIFNFLIAFQDLPKADLDKISLTSLLGIMQKSVFICESIEKTLKNKSN